LIRYSIGCGSYHDFLDGVVLLKCSYWLDWSYPFKIFLSPSWQIYFTPKKFYVSLQQTEEHIPGHLWHRYFEKVNQVMMATEIFWRDNSNPTNRNTLAVPLKCYPF
jgi:hypothetical protein